MAASSFSLFEFVDARDEEESVDFGESSTVRRRRRVRRKGGDSYRVSTTNRGPDGDGRGTTVDDDGATGVSSVWNSAVSPPAGKSGMTLDGN